MIGIISFHCQYNYGSALQAWALQTKLGQLGHKSKVLNYYYEKDMKAYDVRWYSTRIADCIPSGLKGAIKKILRS